MMMRMKMNVIRQRLKDLTKPLRVGKTSETFESLNNVVVICYKITAHSEKCIVFALEMQVFNRLNV